MRNDLGILDGKAVSGIQKDIARPGNIDALGKGNVRNP